MDKPKVVEVKKLVLEERAPPSEKLIVEKHGPDIDVGGDAEKEDGFFARIRKMLGF